MTVLVTVLFLALAALATGKPGNPNPGNPNPGNSNPGHPNPGNSNPGHPNPGNQAKPAKPTAAKSGSPAAAQYQYGRVKVTICHKGKTIRVAQPAVRAHLRHGDSPGPCP